MFGQLDNLPQGASRTGNVILPHGASSTSNVILPQGASRTGNIISNVTPGCENHRTLVNNL